MSIRALCFLLLVLLPGLALAKSKNSLPDWVTQAHTVRVVVSPDAADFLNHPMANSDAQQAVERALADWGRFTLVEGQESDLVITVRAGGKAVSPTLETGPTDTREEVQPGNGKVRIFGQQGRAPANADPTAEPQHTNPHVGKRISRGDDVFEVFRGGVAYSAHSTAVWRYAAKDALKTPNVPAVEQFRKAIAAAEQHNAPQKKP
jgi:hypothetical protein